LDIDEIDLGTSFLGKKLKTPLLISSMTGGFGLARKVNRNLAAAAQELGLAMGVGSQRVAIEEPSVADSFQVRDLAPDILLLGNLGAVQLNYDYGIEQCRRAVAMIGADGLILHLNVLQEAVQPEGNRNFKGLTEKIAAVCQKLEVPVVAKEVGSGISVDVALRLARRACAPSTSPARAAPPGTPSKRPARESREADGLCRLGIRPRSARFRAQMFAGDGACRLRRHSQAWISPRRSPWAQTSPRWASLCWHLLWSRTARW
jgi:hypothetical protein